MRRSTARSWSEIAGSIVCYGIVITALIVVIAPVYWLIISSFKPPTDILSVPPKWLFFKPTLGNYQQVFSDFGIRPIINSLIVTVGAVSIAIVFGCPAAYGLARQKTRTTKMVGAAIFGTRFLPTVAFILPLFLVFANLGLAGTHIGVMAAYQIILLPVVLYTMWSFFLGVPLEVEDAARLDGLGSIGVLFRISIPMVSDGLLATVMMCVIFSWNQFFMALILAGKDSRVVTVVLQTFKASEDQAMAWGSLYAWTTVIMAPVLLFGLIMSTYLLRALTGSKEGTVE